MGECDWPEEADEEYSGDDAYYDDEREEAQLFGCACENPLSVDDCCPSCIAWLQEQERDDGVRERFVESLRQQDKGQR